MAVTIESTNLNAEKVDYTVEPLESQTLQSIDPEKLKITAEASSQRRKMARRVQFHFTILLLSLLTIGAFCASTNNLRRNTGPDPAQVSKFQELIDSLEPSSLHTFLHKHLEEKYQHGVFQDDKQAIEVAYSDDAEVATILVELVRRQGNGTSATPPNIQQSQSSSTEPTSPTKPPTTSSEQSTPPPPPPTTTPPTTSKDSTQQSSSSTTSAPPPPTTSKTSEPPSSTPTEKSSTPPPTSPSSQSTPQTTPPTTSESQSTLSTASATTSTSQSTSWQNSSSVSSAQQGPSSNTKPSSTPPNRSSPKPSPTPTSSPTSLITQQIVYKSTLPDGALTTVTSITVVTPQADATPGEAASKTSARPAGLQTGAAVREKGSFNAAFLGALGMAAAVAL